MGRPIWLFEQLVLWIFWKVPGWFCEPSRRFLFKTFFLIYFGFCLVTIFCSFVCSFIFYFFLKNPKFKKCLTYSKYAPNFWRLFVFSKILSCKRSTDSKNICVWKTIHRFQKLFAFSNFILEFCKMFLFQKLFTEPKRYSVLKNDHNFQWNILNFVNIQKFRRIKKSFGFLCSYSFCGWLWSHVGER